MSDLSITELMTAYGQWVRADQNNLGCKSPSLTLMRSAPHQCKDVKPPKSSTRLFISDDDALAIDKAMNALKHESLHHNYLYRIVDLHFVGGWSYRQISDDYWSAIEYPCGTKKVAVYHIKAMICEGMGFISGMISANKRRDMA